jgi:hypothetical protein
MEYEVIDPPKFITTRNMLKKWYRQHNKGQLPINWDKRPDIIVEKKEEPVLDKMKSFKINGYKADVCVVDDCVVTSTVISNPYDPEDIFERILGVPHPNKQQANNKEENTMATYAALAYDAASRLKTRLRQEFNTKCDELREKFNLNGIEQPSTFKQLKEMLANGNIVVDTPSEDDNGRLYDGWRYSLKLVDPKRMPDQKGFDAAYASMQKAYDAALDIIVVKGGDDGLKALNEFQAATFA